MNVNRAGGFYCSRDLDYDPLGYDTMQSGKWISTFWRNKLPLFFGSNDVNNPWRATI